MTEKIGVTFGGLMQAALDSKAARRLQQVKGFEISDKGIASFELPLFAKAALAPADVGSAQGDRVAADIGFVRGDPSVETILRRVPVFYGPSDAGELPFGSGLPSVNVRVEGTTRTAAESSAAIGSTPYTVSRFEAFQELSTQAVMQSGPDILTVVEDAAREALARKMIQQMFAGSGTDGQWAALLGVTGILSATYATANRGTDVPFLTAEEALIDAGARLPGMAWALGTDLESAAARALLEPGSDRRVIERRTMQLTGTQTARDGSLTATDGLLADWSQAVAIVYTGEELLQIVIDRVTKPGSLRVWTIARLGLAVVRPGLVYHLSEA